MDREGLYSKKGAQEVIYLRGSKSGCLPVELGVAIRPREIISVGEIVWDSEGRIHSKYRAIFLGGHK